jgi:hypothetical protein
MSTVEQLEGVGRPPESLWRRLRAQPERSPELIALAAAERFGPQAAGWVQLAGAGQTPEKLARTAYRKHVRLARLEGGALGIFGIWTAAADVVALLWIQGRMVFYIAAAYGYDPNHPMRPAELLALQGVYPTAEEARRALDGLGKPMTQALVEQKLRGGRDRAIFERLVRYAGKKAAQRAAGRLIPLVAAPIGAVQNAAATKELGRRALEYYGGEGARP